MASAYTKTKLIEMIEKAADDMAVFYQQDFINYRGKTADTDEHYSEVIAEWCCNNISRFAEIPQITREKTYKVDGHDGIANDKSNRTEELIAMAMKRQGVLSVVGTVIDYQTPLKNKRSDRAGKIDLLAYDGTTLRILELKEPESDETMLRCVLEGYTYLQTVNHTKLLCNFGLPEQTILKACPFVFAGGKQQAEMDSEHPWLKKLMSLLDSKPYYIRKENEKYIVEA